MNKFLIIIVSMLCSLNIHATDKISARLANTNLSINLENETSFCAIQIDVKLPEGISATSVDATGRFASTPTAGNVKSHSFVLRSGVFENNMFRVIAYAADAHAISESRGKLFNINLSAVPAESSDIEIRNIRLIKTSDLSEVKLSNVVCRDADSEDVYYIRKAETANGTITIANTSVAPGGSTTVTITPDDNYIIDHVTINGVNADSQLNGNTLTITNIRDDKEIAASFKPIPATSMAFSSTSCVISVGAVHTLSASFSPETVIRPSLYWESSNESVVTVDNGVVTAVGTGTAIVTAYAQDGSGISATCTFNVVESQVGDTDIANYDNILYFERTEASPNSQITLSLKMKNSVLTQGFQCDVCLPSGATFATDEDGFYLTELSTERTTSAKTNYFDTALQPDGSLRILCNSTRGYTFSDNDGEVAIITINLDDDIAEGDHSIIIRNIEISDNQSQAYTQDYVKSTLAICSYIFGDANGDKKVTVTDFTAVANAILGTPPAIYIERAADVNSDGKVTVSDLTGIANIILYGSVNPSSNAKSRVCNTSYAPEVYMPAFCIEPNSTIEVPVYINNGTTSFSAYQMDINLPHGLAVSDICIVEDRISDHVLQGAIMEDGAYRLLSYSTRGNEFIGNNGAVAVLTISADDIAHGDYVGKVSEIELAKDGNPYYANSSQFCITVGDATGIMNINNGDGIQRTYNVSGVETNSMRKGINIIKYSDGTVKKSIVK